MNALARDRGSAAVEIVLLTPVLVLLVLFVVYAGRGGASVEQVRHAADQGARAASLASPANMASAARAAVTADLRENGSSCTSASVSVSTGVSNYLHTVTVHVSCRVSTNGLGLLGIDGAVIDAGSTEVIDRFRSTS